MEGFVRTALVGLVSGMAVVLAACGGGGGNPGGGGGGNNPTTPTVTVTPGANSISVDQSLQVTITVAGSPTPSGKVTLTGGTYASPDATLSGGRATMTVPAIKLGAGSTTLTAQYTPDSASSNSYTSSTGTALISVGVASPTVTVTPSSPTIETGQALRVTVSVTGFAGGPTPTGNVTLTAGTFHSGAKPLTAGSATIDITAGSMAVGSATLTASYSPDNTGATVYAGASNTTTVTVITQSTVTVNESTALATVTDQLLGMNLESWYDVVGNATPINAAFGKAGIKAIRWPGGSWSDIWHWRASATNLLPYNCNDPGPGTGWGGYTSFADFVTSIAKGGPYDLALTANYGSNATCDGGGDPTEAAGWVAEAVSEGIVPSHVTVGNENYGSWEFDLHANKHDASTYASSVMGANGFYKLIKNASPNTLVGVVVDANCTTSSGCTNGWDSTVLSSAKGSYDFVEYHYYPQYTDVTSDTYLVQQAALDFTKYINTVKSELATAGVPNTPIYVGEVGGNSANPGTQSWSITQGLYAGQLLGEAMNDGVSRLTWWDGFGNCFGPGNNSPLLYGWQSWGAQSVFSDGPSETKCPGSGPIGTLSPTARAFQLFSHLATNGASALSTSVTGDTTNIRAYTAAQSDGSNVLFLFNLNQNQSKPVTIKLSGGSPSANDVTVITYDKSLYDGSNPANPGGVVWADPITIDKGPQDLPLTLTLTPWSMNVVIIK
jgi:hypothetical protein